MRIGFLAANPASDRLTDPLSLTIRILGGGTTPAAPLLDVEPVRQKRVAFGGATRTGIVRVAFLAIETEACNPQLHGSTQGKTDVNPTACVSATTLDGCSRHGKTVQFP